MNEGEQDEFSISFSNGESCTTKDFWLSQPSTHRTIIGTHGTIEDYLGDCNLSISPLSDEEDLISLAANHFSHPYTPTNTYRLGDQGHSFTLAPDDPLDSHCPIERPLNSPGIMKGPLDPTGDIESFLDSIDDIHVSLDDVILSSSSIGDAEHTISLENNRGSLDSLVHTYDFLDLEDSDHDIQANDNWLMMARMDDIDIITCPKGVTAPKISIQSQSPSRRQPMSMKEDGNKPITTPRRGREEKRSIQPVMEHPMTLPCRVLAGRAPRPPDSLSVNMSLKGTINLPAQPNPKPNTIGPPPSEPDSLATQSTSPSPTNQSPNTNPRMIRRPTNIPRPNGSTGLLGIKKLDQSRIPTSPRLLRPSVLADSHISPNPIRSTLIPRPMASTKTSPIPVRLAKITNEFTGDSNDDSSWLDDCY